MVRSGTEASTSWSRTVGAIPLPRRRADPPARAPVSVTPASIVAMRRRAGDDRWPWRTTARSPQCSEYCASGGSVSPSTTPAPGTPGSPPSWTWPPDFITLDRELVTGIDLEPLRRAMATALVSFAAEPGAEIVAEGIETEGEMRAERRGGGARRLS